MREEEEEEREREREKEEERSTSRSWHNSLLSVLSRVQGKRYRDKEALEQVRSTLREDLDQKEGAVPRNGQKTTLESDKIFKKPLEDVSEIKTRRMGSKFGNKNPNRLTSQRSKSAEKPVEFRFKSRASSN